MSETQITELASRPRVVRRFLDPYGAWISAKLGCPMEDAVLLELDFPIVRVATEQVLPGVPLRGEDLVVVRDLKRRVESLELPPGSFPMFQVHETRSPYGRLTSRRTVFEADWQDSLVVIRLRDFPAPIVAASIPIPPGAGPKVSDSCDCVMVKREHVREFLELVRRIRARAGSPSLYVHGNGRRQISRLTWDDLVLGDSVVELVRRDLEMFLGREPWFRRRRLPFRRAYLFHGPPGNGKTSVIRAMLHGANLDGHTIPLFNERTDDVHIERMFQLAASTAPSLIVLEDLDRAFSRVLSPRPPSRVSLPQLLNCLDGLGTQEGVVVVATANDPSGLDPAILERPGRFDRIVAFPVPNRELRMRYFRKLSPDLEIGELEDCLASSEGISFAQLREVYILAGQRAYEKNREVSGRDLAQAVNALREGLAAATRRKHELGFFAPPGAVAVPRCVEEAVEQ